MKEKDITEKNLEEYNDVFADIVNVLLFNGKLLVKEDELEDVKTKSLLKLNNQIHEEERDTAKLWTKKETLTNIKIALLGLENQTAINTKMPLRVMAYDGSSYKEQLLKKNTKGMYPVITLVLYFGEKRWKKPLKLSDCFNVPKELKPYFNDYKINLIEVSYLDPKVINKFQSDFKIVADYFVQKRINKDYKPSKDTIKHVDAILKLMDSLSDDHRFNDVINDINKQQRRNLTMCEVLDKIENRGIQTGIKQGIQTGIDRQLNEDFIVFKSLIDDGLISEKDIEKKLKQPKLFKEWYKKNK